MPGSSIGRLLLKLADALDEYFPNLHTVQLVLPMDVRDWYQETITSLTEAYKPYAPRVNLYICMKGLDGQVPDGPFLTLPFQGWIAARYPEIVSVLGYF